MTRRSFQFLALALTPVLLLTACNKSADATSKDSVTIKIGEFASLTGGEAAFGRSAHNGTLLAVEDINAAGGVLGKIGRAHV